jgi:glycosyltransferase involved in cell wall biosynthesis
MHIVFFSHYYPPEVNAPASRTSEHCREWVRHGHDVTVVTCAPNHPSGKVYPSYRNRLYQTEWIHGVHVIRLWTFLAANDGFLLRTLNYVSYLVAAVLALPTLRRPDVIVSTSPQFFCGLAGLAARFIKKAPWVLEIRDLWPESIVTVGAMRRNWSVRLLEVIEALAYRRADRIVSVTHSFVPHIAERAGNNPAKIVVITNGVDVSHFKAETDSGNTKRELGLEGKFVAAYVGTHGMAHGLEMILEAAALLRDQPRIAFLLVGDGAERSRIERLKQERQLDNVLILGQRSKESMPSIWAATDASLILLRRNALFRKVVPSKMFEAMAMRRPIILAVEGEARALLEEVGAGIAITPESAHELAAAVVRLADDPDFAAALGASGAKHVREHYDRARLAWRYLALLEETRCNFSPAHCHGAERGQEINRPVMPHGPLHRAARAIAFGRHIPIAKLVRRLELDVRRRLHDRLGSFRFGSKQFRRRDFVHLSPAGRGRSDDKAGGSGEGGLPRADRAQPLTRYADAFQPLPTGEVKGVYTPRLLRIFTQDVLTSVTRTLKTGAPAQTRALERAIAPPGPLLQPDGAHVDVLCDALRFSFLGRTQTMPRSAIDWQVCSGPEHQLWRMNLHYMAYLKNMPDSLWGEIVTSWIEANEPCRPRAWKDAWNSYALSLRVVEWMQELVRRAGRLPNAFVARAEASLALQLLFLERNLETDIGGNHLMKNIRALIWASAFFAGAEAARWRAKGVKLLGSELERQILSDGMHFERSPSYHCQVFADLLEICYALGHDPLGGRLWAALAQMAAVVTDLTHPDGRVALFNDAGLSMAETPSACLAAYERLFALRSAPRHVFALKEAGYYGLRSGDSYLVVDCGRIAPDDLPAHGHGDVLSFEWSVAGQRLIVDQGVFEYVAGNRRQESRSAANHNTLCFADADQADFFGAFRCGRRPNVEILEYAPRADGFALAGTHNGFRHLPGRPRHVRRFEARPREIRIQDRIEGRPDRTASIGFLLHPGAHVEVSGHVARIVCRAAKIEMLSTLPICVEQAVWWPDMGCEHATHRLRIDVAPGVREVQTTLCVKGHIQK